MAESTRQRLAFNMYWDLGANRSIDKLRQKMLIRRTELSISVVPSLRTLYEWSSRYHWQDQIADLEEEARGRDREEKVAQLREMKDRQMREGLALQQKGLAKLQSVAVEEIGAGDAIRAILEGAKLERLALGEPTEIEQMEAVVEHQHDFSRFSDEELRNVIEWINNLTETQG